MGQASAKLRRAEDGFSFWCPGCSETHAVNAGWKFDGNLDRPTFSPSILTTSGHYLSGHKPGDECWCAYAKKHPNRPSSFKCRRCHSFLRAGRLEFLTDCSHALAGRTVELPDLPAFLRDRA